MDNQRPVTSSVKSNVSPLATATPAVSVVEHGLGTLSEPNADTVAKPIDDLPFAGAAGSRLTRSRKRHALLEGYSMDLEGGKGATRKKGRCGGTAHVPADN